MREQGCCTSTAGASSTETVRAGRGGATDEAVGSSGQAPGGRPPPLVPIADSCQEAVLTTTASLAPALLPPVKSPNYLVDAHWRVKASDFNLSRLLADQAHPGSVTGGGASNPIWLVSARAGGRGSGRGAYLQAGCVAGIQSCCVMLQAAERRAWLVPPSRSQAPEILRGGRGTTASDV